MELGNIFKQAWEVFKKNVAFFLTVGVIYFIVGVISYAFQAPILALLVLLCGIYVFYTLVKACVSAVKGNAVDFSYFRADINKFLKFIGVMAILMAAGMVLSMAFIVPGILMAEVMPALAAMIMILFVPAVIAFAVLFAFPVYMVTDNESLTVTEILKNSLKLSLDNRWKVLLVIVMFFLINFAGSITLIGTIFTAPFGILFMAVAYSGFIGKASV
ncbi:MAG: hypothetical protein FWC85_01135 [Elusimicrobia bacterium]|nr:hypothetical protein [Elusimicrobiota bacterium]